MSDLGAIRARHYKVREGVCVACSGYDNRTDWPCDAVRLLDRLEQVGAENEKLRSHLEAIEDEARPLYAVLPSESAVEERARWILDIADRALRGVGLLPVPQGEEQ